MKSEREIEDQKTGDRVSRLLRYYERRFGLFRVSAIDLEIPGTRKALGGLLCFYEQ